MATRFNHSGLAKKGEIRNPEGGRSVHPPDLTAARALNKTELERILNKYLYMERPEVKQVLDKPDGVPMIELIVAKIAENALKFGDDKRLNFLLERLVGKVQQNIEIKGIIKHEGIGLADLKAAIEKDPFIDAKLVYTKPIEERIPVEGLDGSKE